MRQEAGGPPGWEAKTAESRRGDGDPVYEALHERPENDEAYIDLEDRPVREVVEQICDLCIEVDWSRWTGEGWRPLRSRAEPKARHSISPAARACFSRSITRRQDTWLEACGP